MEQITYTCKGPYRIPPDESVHFYEMRSARKGCGEDLTRLINEVPEDGKDYTVTCPVCGTESRVMRTPPA